MEDSAELCLVVKALVCRLSNAVEWKSFEVSRRIRHALSAEGLTPEGILRDLRDFVRGNGEVQQVVENRPEWKAERTYYYRAILPVPCYRLGLFVEMILADDDPDVPYVVLVNAHEQLR